MKRSLKSTPPTSFLDWIASEIEVHGANPEFNTLQNPEKYELRMSLVREQGFLCVYCGRSLSYDLSDGHIDHFWPQSIFNGISHPDDRRLDYQNLFQSCGPSSLPAPTAATLPDTCGDAKGNWYDEEHYIIPTERRCEARFQFSPTGTIHPRDSTDIAAINMISVLRLNDPALCYERRKVIRELESAILSSYQTIAEIRGEIESATTPHNDRLIGFSHVVTNYLQDELDLMAN